MTNLAPDNSSLQITGSPVPGGPFFIQVTGAEPRGTGSGTATQNSRKYPYQDLKTGFAGYEARDRERGETGFALSLSASLTGAGPGSLAKPVFRKCD